MNNTDRRQKALEVRIAAAKLAANRPHPRHIDNGDEQKFRRPDGEKPGKTPSYLASFTKGLLHEPDTGLVADPAEFQKFIKGIDSGDPRDFRDTQLGPTKQGDEQIEWRTVKAMTNGKDGDPVEVRAWESQGAGNTFDLEGPDAQAVTMSPAPAIGSDELIAEMGEVYVQALLRDKPFTQFANIDLAHPQVEDLIGELNKLAWFDEANNTGLSLAELGRKRGQLTRQTAFRGITPGDDIGPYISQFMLVGNSGINGKDAERSVVDGLISYGAVSIDQRVRFATPKENYMINWDEWLDVQNGADLSKLEAYEDDPKRRFITTPRDLATYVHYDALYEAYLNACLILLGLGVGFDPGIPFQANDADDHQQGFAHFGGPHILSLVTEVATRALKAVRFQKFNVHRRLRPEALAGRLAKYNDLMEQQTLKDSSLDVKEVKDMVDGLKDILSKVHGANKEELERSYIERNVEIPEGLSGLASDNYLLPMAFCEGSPMHPTYGAGHATVAGACVTILKAFFDHKRPLAVNGDPSRAYVARYEEGEVDGEKVYVSKLDDVPVLDKDGNPCFLTVEGELNKLASNISIGRNWAGVHYFSDYIESLRMGEQIAIGILEEQKLTYGENFSMTVPLYDGGSIRI